MEKWERVQERSFVGIILLEFLRKELEYKIRSKVLQKGIQILECSWKGLTLTLQETQSIHDSMNIPKI